MAIIRTCMDGDAIIRTWIMDGDGGMEDRAKIPWPSGPWCQCSQIADGFDHRAAKLIKVDEAIAVAVRRFDH